MSVGRKSHLDPKFEEMLRQDIEEYLSAADDESTIVYEFSVVGTLADYLEIRQKNIRPDFPAYAFNYDTFERLMLLDTAGELGVPAKIFFRASYGDPDAIDLTALTLLHRTEQASRLSGQSHAVRRKLAASNADINYIAAVMLETCMTQGVIPPHSLTYLISLRLVGNNPRGDEKASIFQLVQRIYYNMGPDWPGERNQSVRAYAKAAGVSPSTIVRRWPQIERAFVIWNLAEGPPEDWLEPPIPHNRDFKAKIE